MGLALAFSHNEKHPGKEHQMKYGRIVVKLAPAAVVGICIATLLIPRWGPACGGSRTTTCTVNPAACLKSMVLTKSVPGPVFPIPCPGGGSLAVSNNLFIVCPATNNCGAACTNVGVPVSASLTVTLNPPAACGAAAPS